jgi:hypothetical protein
MHLEAFTLAKNPNDAARNEDRYVVVPGRAYAVIDGVSDKTGLRYNGLTGGQAAGQAVEEIIREVCRIERPETIEADWLSARLQERFRTLLDEISASGTSEAPPATWFGAQLALALEGRTAFRFIVIGDSGLRLNGREVFRFRQPLDDICAAIRKAVWNHLGARGVPSALKNEIARAYTVEGLAAVLPRWMDWIDENTLPGLRQKAIADAARIQRKLDHAVIEKAVLGGLREQNLYINRIHPLGSPCINGFPIPHEFIMQFDRNIDDVETIELFTDGYFGYPNGTRVADWEEHLARIEAVDPEKTGDYASTKGSANGLFTDDRTVLILRRAFCPVERSVV